LDHHPDNLVTARILIVLYGTGARDEARRRADLATAAKELLDVVRWSLVAAAIEALEAGDLC
jgi:hypothetical protein